MIAKFCPEWIEHKRKLPREIIKVIEDFVHKVLKEYPDAEIYLFGSYARGDWLINSDIDLIVISNYFRNVNWFERLTKLRLLASFDYSFEILAYTRDEFQRKLSEIGIIQEASKYWIRITC